MRKGRFKKIIVLLVVVATAVVMLLTCPAKEAHCDAVDQELSDIVMEGFYSNPGMESFAPLAGLFMPSVVSSLVKTQLNVSNFFLVSAGYVNYNGKRNYVSLGVFGHVFVFGHDKIKESIMGIEDSFFDVKGRYDKLDIPRNGVE